MKNEELLPSEDTQLKPCPFCGTAPIIKDEEFRCTSKDCLWMSFGGADLKFMEDWNNAWAHKRIAELEKSISIRDEHIKNLNESMNIIISESEKTIATLTGKNMIQHQENIKLNARVAGMKKLALYSKHLSHCAFNTDFECTCGLIELQSAAELQSETNSKGAI